VATALLAVPNRALAEDQLCELIDAMLKLQRLAPFSPYVYIPAIDGKLAIAATERVEACRRLNLPGGDVLYANEEDAKVLSYYCNMTSHLFLMPAVVARLFHRRFQL
jgi:glycerol-3-phosphate O-acyltransferase